MTEVELANAYRQYGALVLRRCRRILRDDATAEDALQEAFARLWRHGDGFSSAGSKVAWLYRVADRCCFDQLARRRTRRETTLGDNALPADGVAPGQALEHRELVLGFLDRFDDRVKQIAVLHFVDELGQDEIAAATGWSRQTVSKKLALLRERAERWRGMVAEGRIP